jgi:hypothetical protein
MKNSVLHWKEGYESDPHYVELQGQIKKLSDEIRHSLAPDRGFVNRHAADRLKSQLGSLRAELAALKRTFLVPIEIEIPEGVSYVEG